MSGNNVENHGKREMPRTFAQKLKYFRNLRGYTCRELGLLAGIDPAYVNRMELGKRKGPSFPIIQDLAKALKVDVKDLVDIEFVENDMPMKSIQEVLVYNEYLIKGKLPSMKTRENLLALMQTMLDCEWSENKHIETVNITEKVNQFLNSLKQ